MGGDSDFELIHADDTLEGKRVLHMEELHQLEKQMGLPETTIILSDSALMAMLDERKLELATRTKSLQGIQEACDVLERENNWSLRNTSDQLHQDSSRLYIHMYQAVKGLARDLDVTCPSNGNTSPQEDLNALKELKRQKANRDASFQARQAEIDTECRALQVRLAAHK